MADSGDLENASTVRELIEHARRSEEDQIIPGFPGAFLYRRLERLAAKGYRSDKPGVHRLENDAEMVEAIQILSGVLDVLLDLAESAHRDQLWDRPLWNPAKDLQDVSTLLGAMSIFADNLTTHIDPTPLHRLWHVLTVNDCLWDAGSINELRAARQDALVVFWRLGALTKFRADNPAAESMSMPAAVRWSQRRTKADWVAILQRTNPDIPASASTLDRLVRDGQLKVEKRGKTWRIALEDLAREFPGYADG